MVRMQFTQLASIILLVLVAKQGAANFACYSELSCVPASRLSGTFSTIESCCTMDNGLSYETAEPCGECIVYGWVGDFPMMVKKGQTLDLNVTITKGSPSGQILLRFEFDSTAVSLNNKSQIILGTVTSEVVKVTIADDESPATEQVDIVIILERSVGGDSTDVFRDRATLTIPLEEVTIGFTKTSIAVNESNGTLPVCFTAISHQYVALDVRVDTVDGTATESEDYSLEMNKFSITTNSTTCFNVTIESYDNREYDENFTLKLSSNYSEIAYVGSEADITIIDTSEAKVILSPSSDVLYEGEGGGLCISVNDSDIDITLTLGDDELSRILEDADTNDTLNNITLSVGEEKCIEVSRITPHLLLTLQYTVIDDPVMEGTEKITLNWKAEDDRVVNATFTLIITDNDDCPEQNIRLVHGNESSGLVEVCHDFEWRSVCDDYWTTKDAILVCKQLGFLPFINTANGRITKGEFKDDEPVKYWLDDVKCRGNESTLFECKHNTLGEHNCRRNERAGVHCLSHDDIDIRLTPNDYIELGLRGEYRPVCANFWSIEDARVACRQLGNETSNPLKTATPYHGQGWMDYVKCKGDEEYLFKCQSHFGAYCHHRAGVRC